MVQAARPLGERYRERQQGWIKHVSYADPWRLNQHALPRYGFLNSQLRSSNWDRRNQPKPVIKVTVARGKGEAL